MPYTWSDNMLHRLFQIEIVLGVFFIFQGIVFLSNISLLMGLVVWFATPVTFTLDRIEKLEAIITKAVKKSKER